MRIVASVEAIQAGALAGTCLRGVADDYSAVSVACWGGVNWHWTSDAGNKKQKE